MKYLPLLFLSVWVLSCAQDQNFQDTQIYKEEISKLSEGMARTEVENILGLPKYSELIEERSCALYSGISSDGRAILHEVQFSDDMMTKHLVGLDTGMMACAVQGAMG